MRLPEHLDAYIKFVERTLQQRKNAQEATWNGTREVEFIIGAMLVFYVLQKNEMIPPNWLKAIDIGEIALDAHPDGTP